MSGSGSYSWASEDEIVTEVKRSRDYKRKKCLLYKDLVMQSIKHVLIELEGAKYTHWYLKLNPFWWVAQMVPVKRIIGAVVVMIDFMIFCFTTTHALSVYHHYRIQHYVIKFVRDFRQVGGFLRYPLSIKLTTTI